MFDDNFSSYLITLKFSGQYWSYLSYNDILPFTGEITMSFVKISNVTMMYYQCPNTQLCRALFQGSIQIWHSNIFMILNIFDGPIVSNACWVGGLYVDSPGLWKTQLKHNTN